MQICEQTGILYAKITSFDSLVRLQGKLSRKHADHNNSSMLNSV